MKRDKHKQRQLSVKVILCKRGRDRCERYAQKFSQPAAEPLAALEFQLQNRGTQGSSIEPVAAGEIEFIFAVPTTSTNACLRCAAVFIMGRHFGAERHSATFADKSLPTLDALPAGRTYVDPAGGNKLAVAYGTCAG
jgi:hypothetical protein